MSDPLDQPIVRERRPDDLPVLCDLLAAQQAESSYPVRWPLPFPVHDFLVRPGELKAWVVEVDGEVAGHVTAASVDEALAPVFEGATGAHGHHMVSVLFTGAAARGRGLGGLLLDTAVAWIRERGHVPVLDVVPVHAPALALYRSRGWVEVGSWRFPWLAPELPDVALMALPPYPSRSSTPR
ncbi:GNAT family N-acetyltransferase [Nocardioides rubriscoriae]|uniref:GNAT family N-acetyltransferase n=1 Tax=Nocardioides rubriscoriae TaxID=642762 RepID=UPI001B86D6F8|nr:GNAT family N-acetyltransferase [Nocardioides rubriscoriae]